MTTAMDPMTDGRRAPDCHAVIEAAIRFVALQPGGARRILIEHHQGPNGTCAGCMTTPVTWPCVTGVIATRALELDAAR
jgi:hypothetical protein